MRLLEQKVAVVTGAKIEDGQVGIGGATARAVVREGGKVVLLNRTLETARALVDELNEGTGVHVASALQVDLSDAEQIPPVVAAAVAEFGRVDIIVNNAAVTGRRQDDGALLSVDIANWDAIFTLNVRAPFVLIKSVLPFMLSQGEGSIVNVSSTASLSGDFVRSAYGPSKSSQHAVALRRNPVRA